jgi:hypothetical protein
MFSWLWFSYKLLIWLLIYIISNLLCWWFIFVQNAFF